MDNQTSNVCSFSLKFISESLSIQSVCCVLKNQRKRDYHWSGIKTSNIDKQGHIFLLIFEKNKFVKHTDMFA